MLVGVPVEEDAIAVIRDFIPAAKAVAIDLSHDEINLALDPSTVRRRRQRWPGEEVRLAVVLVVDEEAAHRVREEAPQPEKKPAVLDELVPCLADALRRREAASWETAEDVRQQVVG